MIKVAFIYADGCSDCLRMRFILEKYLDHLEIIEAEADEDRAVSLALENGIEDLPGCNILGDVFQGEKFSSKKLEKCIKNHINS